MFVPKSRKVKYECHLTIYDLQNLPYVSGLYFCKWKLSSSTIKGVTSRKTVSDNQVSWNASYVFECTLIINKNGSLQDTHLDFSIKQEVDGGKKAETVGRLSLNLAELAGAPKNVQRHLLQQTKLNSLLKVEVEMILISGDPQSIRSANTKQLDEDARVSQELPVEPMPRESVA
ncbi:N-terminal C2 in EEIG1 and EHBP1 proteins-domain-containing protein [Gorgonomyces haynaldii]|nr:N-terminal C2 in EEIG1 and EHBP1 proteins-domain-containing protein [Gorgonomyces haynaldii]